MSKSFYPAKRLLILLLCLIFSVQLLLSQEKEKAEKVRKIISEYGQVEVTVPFTDKKTAGDLGRYVSVGTIRDKNVHVILSGHTVDWFLSQNFSFEIIERTPFKGISGSAGMRKAMEWNSYPSYFQYDSIMQFFSVNYPDICRLDTIGTSINGKMIFALKISDNVRDDEDEPEVFYTSSMHGDETGGFILMLRLIDHLLKNYSVNGRVQRLVNSLEIWINPLANPDGTYRDGNLIINPVRWNATGVDLNRNFPDPDQPGIVQAKETTDMIRFMKEHRFVLSANFHSGTEVVNYPWDRWSRYHPDDEWFHLISRKYADTAHAYSVPTYMRDLDNGITRGSDWYLINGGRQDFVTYELHGREVTIELDDTFITPASELENLWNYNRNSLIGYLENALYGIHGKVTDSGTAEPLPAGIFIRRHDTDNSHVVADSLTGSFVRMLAPGRWELTITAKGYRDTVLADLVLGTHHRIDLAVEMKPSVKYDPVLYPNPVNTILKIDLPPEMSGRVSISVFNSSGIRVAGYFTRVITGTPVEFDVSRFSSGLYTIQFANVLSGVRMEGKFVVIRQ